jgi:hypothetical protein
MTLTRTDLYPGATVTVDDPKYPGVWTVEKINPRTIGLRRGPQRLRASAAFLSKAEPGATVEAVPIPELFDVGALVTFAGKPGLWVVIKQSADRVNVAQLGGDNGRYWRTTARSLTRVPVDADMLGALLGA